MAVKDYNTDPDLNTTISGINIAEGCPPSGINNAIRQLMADVKADSDTRALDASVVHKSGEETIAGSKTFTSSLNVTRNDPALNLVHSAVTQGTKPTNAEYWAVNFKDSAGTNIAKMAYSLGSDLGNGNLEFTSTSYNGTTATLRLRANADGTKHLFAPSTPAGAAENEVVTVDYLAGEDANLVHKTGNETIAGSKTFESFVNIQNFNAIKGVNPSSNRYWELFFLDANRNKLGYLQTRYATDGQIFTRITASNTFDGKDVFANVEAIVSKDGIPYATAPSTPAGSTGNQIVTADYLLSTGTYSPGNLPAPSAGVTVTDFNTLTTPGRYHVRYTNTAVNVPMAVTSQADGILVVEQIGSAANISTRPRLRQTFYVFGGLQQQYRTFSRTLTPDLTTVKDWYEVMTSKGGTFTGAISAPTPAATSNDTTVATTAWVRSNLGQGSLVESWHEGANWYRKYSDGWIEQGGVTATTGSNRTISLHTAFTDTNYTVTTNAIRQSTGGTWPAGVDKTSASSFKMYCTDGGAVGADFMWYACGY